MKLSGILSLAGCTTELSADPTVTLATEDSRRAAPGALFVAVHGERADGHAFAEKAAAQGAVAIAGNRQGVNGLAGLPYIYTDAPRRLLGLAAHALAGDPSRHLNVIGITGTNGKTSTAVMVRHILEACGHPTANFGTLGYFAGEADSAPARHTTPFADGLVDLLVRAREQGRTHVVMEVSSHALAQDRVAGVHFLAAAFTNLSQDHLDFHEDMEAYLAAKLKLFGMLDGSLDGQFTAVNRADPSAPSFVAASKVPCYTFGAGGKARAKHVQYGGRATSFTFASPWGDYAVTAPVLGAHNLSNLLCALTICGGLGAPMAEAAEAAASLEPVPGRFEQIDAGQPFQVIVDYAHTEDGLRNVLQAARRLCGRKIITVFGCGGDRDRKKRPRMGAAVAELSDFAIVTSDNPRTEDPERILLDTELGLQQAGKRIDQDYLRILDRREAIRHAIAMAAPGDLVLIAGKGHEDYQILGEERIHFDDREEARNALAQR